MSIAKKLHIKQETPVWLMNVPEDLKRIFDGCEVRSSLPSKAEVGQAVLFVKTRAVLGSSFDKLAGKLADDALLWIAYPKKSGSIKSDIDRDNGWQILADAGYDGVTQIAINKDWSALRFKKSETIKDKIRDVPMAERHTAGIDYANRTTQLPNDARAALSAHEGLEDFFNILAFTHRKEHLEAIAGAKKPETRQRRIDKMVEMLLKMKLQKTTQ